ncbi:unnamed protein product [Camellia sinensis]
MPSSSSLSRLCLHRRRVREHHCHRTRAPPSLRMRFHFDRLSPSSLISLKLSLDRPRISGPPLSQVIDRSFGFDTAVEEAQRAINAAHVEAESVENGVGVVKLMGRYIVFNVEIANIKS